LGEERVETLESTVREHDDDGWGTVAPEPPSGLISPTRSDEGPEGSRRDSSARQSSLSLQLLLHGALVALLIAAASLAVALLHDRGSNSELAPLDRAGGRGATHALYLAPGRPRGHRDLPTFSKVPRRARWRAVRKHRRAPRRSGTAPSPSPPLYQVSPEAPSPSTAQSPAIESAPAPAAAPQGSEGQSSPGRPSAEFGL